VLFSGVNKLYVDKLRRTRTIKSSPLPRGSVVPCATAQATGSVMKVVDVELGDRSYPIYIGTNLLDQGELLRKHVPSKKVLIVTNETIAPLYLDK
jgi:3-dehydroquinate synthase